MSAKVTNVVCRIEHTIKQNRTDNRRTLMIYLNAGDPDLETTFKLIEECVASGVDIIELGVPFPNSFTDGKTVRNSHARALANEIEFEHVVDLITKVKDTLKVSIVILVDFSYTVKTRGIGQVVSQCSECGCDGILIHGLPPLFTTEYLAETKKYDISPIFSLYPNSTDTQITKTVSNAKGFIYLVSQYGRTGGKIDFTSNTIEHFYTNIKSKTNTPLLAGFGIRTPEDLDTIFSHYDIDGVIIGSAICGIIEKSPSKAELYKSVSHYVGSLSAKKSIPLHRNLTKSINNALTP